MRVRTLLLASALMVSAVLFAMPSVSALPPTALDGDGECFPMCGPVDGFCCGRDESDPGFSCRPMCAPDQE
jgi:hypothetical protein